MNPEIPARESLDSHLYKLEGEIIDIAHKLMRSATDPFTGVIRFLHQQPENQALSGTIVKSILLDVFEKPEQIPAIVKLFSGQVRHIVRRANVIDIINEQASQQAFSGHLLKLKDRIKFEVGVEKGCTVLKNIAGLIAVEHGLEVPLDKIIINPPKLEITLRLGLLRPHRTVDMA